MILMKSDFFLVKVRTYTVTYPRNSVCNTNHKCGKDIGYNYDTIVQYQRIKSENLCKFRYFFREVNRVTDV